MASDSDDLEQQLRENLELRRELAAKVDKARDKSAKQGPMFLKTRADRAFFVMLLLLLSGAMALWYLGSFSQYVYPSSRYYWTLEERSPPQSRLLDFAVRTKKQDPGYIMKLARVTRFYSQNKSLMQQYAGRPQNDSL